MSLPHLVRRKLSTFAATIRACENWPAVARARLSAAASVDALHFRDGRKLRPMPPLEETWGEIIEWLCANLSRLPATVPVACEYHHWCPLSLDHLLHLLRRHGFEAESRILYDEAYLFAARGLPEQNR